MASCCHGHSHNDSNHSHGGGGSGGHGHSHGPSDASDAENLKAQEFNLYLKIRMDDLTCLNETEDGSGKLVFRAFEERLDQSKFVASDVDEELLFNIPFQGSVKLKGLLIIGGEQETHPNKMRLFKNRPNMSFEDAHAKPDQEFDVHVDQEGCIEYKPIVARFSDVQHLSIHFPSNHGHSDRTEVFYIGLKGDFTEAHHHEVTITAYESRANPADHKTSSLNQVNQMIS
ncbi:PITH domain-containing protein CG6153-like [Physella acuta]|uniref:PITH domain-containing protein CG6153-like n=1 Tax=Physella acuta TaxID=109671 RepID=UPI0027DE20AA|nr:PITH domain-containing protein CG6153-like [Physella acuta]XP_059144884.1 PITH domain-containing protein CG6153-like [Physella acuta]